MLGKLLSFSDSCLVACVCVCWSLGRVQLYVTPRTVARQSPLSMEFSRQEYWGGLPCSPPGDLPDPGMEPRSSALQASSLPCVTREAPLSRLVVSDSATPCTVAARLLCPWDSPGKNSGVGSHSLLQGIFPTQGSSWPRVSCIAGGFFTV